MRGERGHMPSQSFSTSDDLQFNQEQIDSLEIDILDYLPAKIAENYFLGIINWSKSAWLKQTLNDLYQGERLRLSLLKLYHEKVMMLENDFSLRIAKNSSDIAKFEENASWQQDKLLASQHKFLHEKKAALKLQLEQLQNDIKINHDRVNGHLQQIRQLLMLFNSFSSLLNELKKKKLKGEPTLFFTRDKAIHAFADALKIVYTNKLLTPKYTSYLLAQLEGKKIDLKLFAEEKLLQQEEPKKTEAAMTSSSSTSVIVSTSVKRGTFPTINLKDLKEVNRLINYVHKKECHVDVSWGNTINVVSYDVQTETEKTQVIASAFVEGFSQQHYQSTIIRLTDEVDRQAMIKNALLLLQNNPGTPIEDQEIIKHLLAETGPNEHLQHLTREFKCHEIAENLKSTLGDVSLSTRHLSSLFTPSDKKFPSFTPRSAKGLGMVLYNIYQKNCQGFVKGIKNFQCPSLHYLTLAAQQFVAFLEHPANINTPPTLATGSDPQLIKAWLLISDSWCHCLQRDNNLINQTPYVLKYPEKQKEKILDYIISQCPVPEQVKNMIMKNPPSLSRLSL